MAWFTPKRRKAPAQVRAKPKLTEFALQCAVAEYLNTLEDAGVIVWGHPPLGGTRSRYEGGGLKKQGAKAGEADCLIWPAKRYGVWPFFIELKTENGRVHQAQRERHQLYEAAGYEVHIVKAPHSWAAVAAVKRILASYGLPA